MSYEQEITYRNYSIAFEYDYNSQGLTLVSWTAYVDDNELHIPCAVESEFIESQLNKWLDNEWSRNDFNYIEDKQISLTMKKCEY